MSTLGKTLLALAALLAMTAAPLMAAALFGLSLASPSGGPAGQQDYLSVFLPLATCALLPLTLSPAFRLVARFRR